MRPDDICEKYFKLRPKSKLTVLIEKDMVLIEGKSEALRFLGELLITQSTYKNDCSFFISPKGAGHGFFSKKATKGVYIHRLPCLENKVKK